MATFAFKLTPAYELIDSDGYVENAVGLFKGLSYGTTHPVDFAKAVVDWDTWAQSPGRALGHLLPTIVFAVASAGAGSAGEAAEAAEASEAIEGLKTAETATRTTPSLDTAANVVRKGLPRPSVTDTKLDGLLNDLYRPGAEVGSGSTADALRNEIATGAATGGRWHLQKARDYAVALHRALDSHPTANQFDRLAAEAVLDDLTDAMKEVPFP